MNDTLVVKRNIATSIILQFVTIISGFILPKLILSHFGSEVYGLTSSITQFLNYIQLLEGGLSGVIMAALYKPLATNDYGKVSSVIKAAESFFRKIGLIYAIYVIVLAIVYPLIIGTSFSYLYVCSLVIIIGITLFIQYYFSLTYRILINSDQKGYIVSIANIIFLLFNLGCTIIAYRLYPEIHLIKLINAVSYIIQPIIFSYYVKGHYAIDKKATPDNTAIKQRWDGFGQNLAFFVHSNTDIVILSFFSLGQVSVYAVYSMIISAITSLINSITSAITPSMGNVLVSESEENKNNAFDQFEFVIGFIASTLFTCCILLIVPFVKVYTWNINDVDYSQPLFATLLCVAEAIYCLRSPYISVTYAAGHFKQTAKYSYYEAGINIVLSLVLVFRFGLIGVAIGTLVSMLYRMIALIIYLKHNILNRSILKSIKTIIPFIISCLSSGLIIWFLLNDENITSYYSWLSFATLISLIVIFVQIVFMLLLNRKLFLAIINKYVFKH